MGSGNEPTRSQPTAGTVASRVRQGILAMLIGLGAGAMTGGKASGQGPTLEDEPASLTQSAESPEGYLNLPLPTAGGNQWWTDHGNVAQWRLQQNSLTGHWRLLDPQDIRRCWGSRAACQAALVEATGEQATAEAPDHVIILLHGLMRTRRSMDGLEEYLASQTDAQIIRFSYASTRFGIAEHAAALRDLVEGLPGNPRIDFVGHSMGNIVVRHAIGDWQEEGEKGDEMLNRLGRIVMLGPPNQGAAIARRLGQLGLFQTIVGPGGMELGPQWSELESHLAVPPVPFAIVAGNLSDAVPQNPLVDGESDFVVSVEEARLEGAREFHQLPLLHSFLMDKPQVQQIVKQFLLDAS